MIKRYSLASLISLILVLAAGKPALAIKYGELDGNRHPYVGLMVAYDESGTPLWRCSGTLIAPELFLTAGHCTENPAERVEIWFGADLTNAALHDYPREGDAGEGDVGGTPYTHPEYDPNAFFTHDLGVVVLDEPVYMAEYGQLPEEGQFDFLAKRRGQVNGTFTAVGYGLQNANANHLSALRLRMLARPRLIIMNNGFTGDFSILMSNNANTGGTCFGDSGGPLFYGGDQSNLLVGVTSYGINSQCAGTGGVYRIDRADDLAWLYGMFGSYLQGYQ
jgi:hypothetical protein